MLLYPTRILWNSKLPIPAVSLQPKLLYLFQLNYFMRHHGTKVLICPDSPTIQALVGMLSKNQDVLTVYNYVKIPANVRQRIHHH